MLDLLETICNVWLAGQAGGASAAAWTHVPHHLSWCGPSLHVSHFPNQIESSNCCPALLPALLERHTWRVFLPTLCVCLEAAAESIEWFIEDQAFSPSYDFAPPPPPPPSPASKLSLSQSSWVHKNCTCCRSSLLTGDGARGWDRAKAYDGENAWFSINHSILSALTNRLNLIHNSARSHPNSTRSHPLLC
jgi:hypothetical protein